MPKTSSVPITQLLLAGLACLGKLVCEVVFVLPTCRLPGINPAFSASSANGSLRVLWGAVVGVSEYHSAALMQ